MVDFFVIRLFFAAVYCTPRYMFIGLPMIAGFVPFWFTNSDTSHVNMTSVYTIGVCDNGC